MKRIPLFTLIIPLIAFAALGIPRAEKAADKGLVGYWPLKGDCLDYSGNNNNGINHGADLIDGSFDGKKSYIEVPDSPSLDFGTGDFTINVWIYTGKEVNDIIGDIMDKYDPAARKGITLTVNSSAGGYQSAGTDRHVYFGIDNARGASEWHDCGRPGPASNYISNSLTVFKGKLYAAVGNALEEKDWCHVYRYEGGTEWTDLGRVGTEKTTGVGPMIVHNDSLFVVTTTIDWTRVRTEGYDPGSVYRFDGINKWKNCGKPGENPTLNCVASYRGKLFTGGGPLTWAIYEQDGKSNWKTSIVFEKKGPRRCFPHAMMVFNERLYAGYPYVFSYDGNEWTFAGEPAMNKAEPQVHSMSVYQGRLLAGTFPESKVSAFLGGEDWELLGRVGTDGTEVNSLVVYNGKLYGGSLPRAEVCRYDGKQEWTSLKRFHSPPGWVPVPPVSFGGKLTREAINEMARLTSMTIYDGKLYASTGSCTSSPFDAPLDGVMGKVFCIEAGKMATYDMDLGPGWKQVTAVRKGNVLRLYIDGLPVKTSSSFDPSLYDVSNDRPLRIGFGETDYFNGKISEMRMYNRALSGSEIKKLFKNSKVD